MTTTRETAMEEALIEIDNAPGPDHWVPQFQHVKDIAAAALSTPATEPQGYVEGLEAAREFIAQDILQWDEETFHENTSPKEAAQYIRDLNIPAARPTFISDVMRRLRRFHEVSEDVDGTDVDIGRDWLDALTLLGLLERVRKSPALWQLTDAALHALAARPAPQPAADTRVVTVAQLEAWMGYTSEHGGAAKCLKEIRAIIGTATPAQTYQSRVKPWLDACFGPEIAGDKTERNHRFLEEALELVQSGGCTASEAHQLVDYVYGRPVGEMGQEIGGVMNTLAALCLANGFDMHDAGEVELARVWTKVEKIRAKQAAKPKHSPLPEHPVTPAQPDKITEAARALQQIETDWFARGEDMGPMPGWWALKHIRALAGKGG